MMQNIYREVCSSRLRFAIQVLGIKDEDQKFDMIVRNCVAHDGKRTPIQLVNEMGCVIRPKIMSKFNKIKNFGSSASVVSYAYFQVFHYHNIFTL